MTRTDKAAGMTSFNRFLLLLFNFYVLYWCLGRKSSQNRQDRESSQLQQIPTVCCQVIFMFSVGIQDMKVEDQIRPRVACFNRVMLLLPFSFCVTYWCLGHESGHNRQGCESGWLQQSRLFLLCSFCFLYWCLGHKSGQNRQGCKCGQLQQSHVVFVVQFSCSLGSQDTKVARISNGV